MSKQRREAADPTGRRRFLKGMAAAGGAAAVAVAGQSQAALPAANTPGADAPAKAEGYHETAHIRAYYRATRNS